MHFDDRLATVLRLPATGDSLARIQYRQLVDILSRMPDSVRGTDSSSPLEQAFETLDSLKNRIPAVERARFIAQSGHPLANPRLVAQLAQAEPAVALAAIGRARLSESTWLALIPGLPVGARGILRHRTDLPASVEALLDRLGVQDTSLPQAQAAHAVPAVETPPSSQHGVAEEVAEPLPPLELELAAIFGEDYDAPQPASAPDLGTEAVQIVTPAPFAPVAASFEPAGTEAIALPDNVHALRPARPSEQHPDSEIGAIVRRIEAYRQARSVAPLQQAADGTDSAGKDAFPTAPSRLPASLDFETDSQGRIVWADGPYAPAIVGVQLTLASVSDRARPDSLRIAVAERRPLADHTVRLDGSPLVRGLWRVDAAPDFSSGGGFRGYFGRLRRRPRDASDQAEAPAESAPSSLAGNDSIEDGPSGRLREVLHELRTPANAIQVAAEIIQQQLYGPAPHEYRALAAAVAGDCAHILAGFEELERLIKLETGAMKLDPGECDFSAILSHAAERLRAWTQPRRSGFSLLSAPGDIRVSLSSNDAEMLAWRLLAALAGSTAPDEVLEIGWQRDAVSGSASDMIAIRSALPARLSARSESDFFSAVPGERGQSLAVGAFGTGFTLRLAAAEARAAGGGLRREGNDLVLWLPALTATSAHHSTLDAACFGG